MENRMRGKRITQTDNLSKQRIPRKNTQEHAFLPGKRYIVLYVEPVDLNQIFLYRLKKCHMESVAFGNSKINLLGAFFIFPTICSNINPKKNKNTL